MRNAPITKSNESASKRLNYTPENLILRPTTQLLLDCISYLIVEHEAIHYAELVNGLRAYGYKRSLIQSFLDRMADDGVIKLKERGGKPYIELVQGAL